MAIQISNDTLLKIIVRQGTNPERNNVILDSGELGFTTDTERLFIGNGADYGGILVGNKFLGSGPDITNFSPAEIGDLAYNTDERFLYRLKENYGSNLSDWEGVGGAGIKSDTTQSLGGRNIDNMVAVLSSEWSTLSGSNDSDTFYIVSETNYLNLADLKTDNVILSADDFTVNGFSKMIDHIYPVGSIYLSFDNVNPGIRFTGTTWERRSEGRFIVGVGTGNDGTDSKEFFAESGSDTGKYNHTLTIDELPSHNHKLDYSGGDRCDGWGCYNDSRPIVPQFGAGQGGYRESDTLKTTGDNQSHNNTPPGYGVYVWLRTS